MTTVHIPALLKHLTGNMDRVEVSLPPGGQHTVRDVLARLEQRFPGFAAGIMLEGELSPSIAVFVGEEQALMGLDAQVDGQGTVHFLPPIVGG